MNYVEEYGNLHESGAQKHFAGFTLKKYADRITECVKLTSPRSLMDYGSGKGYQYLLRRYHEKWAPFMMNDTPLAALPYCYDLGVRQLRERCEIKDCFQTCPILHRKSKEPCKKVPRFDGVFSTDMLEHIERQDVPGILDDMLGFITTEDRPTFAFFSVSCIPADKFLRDGRNVHVTMEPPTWWDPILTTAFNKAVAVRPKLLMRVCFEASAKEHVDREWKL